jgi:DNA-binding beta-propeller fold protein YncE
VTEDRLRELLRDHRAPGERAAEERGWRVVHAALALRDVHPARGRNLRRLALTGALGLAIVVGALSPAGAAVSDLVQDIVEPGREPSSEALVSLPAPGRLLAISRQGPWIVQQDGSKRLLGRYEDASWSPHGRFVVATRGQELLALDTKGRVRWSLARRGAPNAPRWSPDGFRVAYLSGRAVRVVAGDGTADRVVVARAGKAAPAWRPGKLHLLAFAGADGSVRVIDTDSRALAWRSAGGRYPTELHWSPDGSRLLALAADEAVLFDTQGKSLGRFPLSSGVRAQTAAFARSSRSFALATYSSGAGTSEVTLVRLRAGTRSKRRVFAGTGRLSDLAWSPDGRWLALGWPTADQWLFIRSPARQARAPRLQAVANITRQFSPGVAGPTTFPRMRGWCCPP